MICLLILFPNMGYFVFLWESQNYRKARSITCKYYICRKKVARNKKKPLFEKIRIESIGAEGKALARVNDIVVFTKLVIPGDVVDLQVIKKRKNYMEAVVTKIHEYSIDRTIPFCKHFGVCGGCKWQYLPYPKQLDYKQQQVNDQLKRIGKIGIPPVMPIIGSKNETFYRNKLEFTFSNKRWITQDEIDSERIIEDTNALGFHIPGMFDKVINIDKCWLQPEPSNEIRNFINAFARENNLSFFDIKNKEGLLRTLIIRTASTGEVMVIVSFYKEDHNSINLLLNAVKEKFPDIQSLMYVINQKANDTISDQEIILFAGKDHIYEEMEGLKFKIGPKSFYQTNSEQAYELYKVAKSFAGLEGNEIVYDLYTGTGTIANFIARNVKKVIGIEYIPEAISDAKENAAINDITNTYFFAGDMKDVLNMGFLEEHGHPDVVITDPPRAGMHDDVIKTLLYMFPKKIVYVSCNPATQARDIKNLSSQYSVRMIQPVDMFPHTHHVENVVLLEAKDE